MNKVSRTSRNPSEGAGLLTPPGFVALSKHAKVRRPTSWGQRLSTRHFLDVTRLKTESRFIPCTRRHYDTTTTDVDKLCSNSTSNRTARYAVIKPSSVFWPPFLFKFILFSFNPSSVLISPYPGSPSGHSACAALTVHFNCNRGVPLGMCCSGILRAVDL